MKTPVTFVYIGEEIPKYACHSLKIANKYSKQRVQLLANRSALSRLETGDFETVAIEEFYDSSLFKSTQPRISGDIEFRNGLWSHSLERFFILAQFMKASGSTEIFHAELDQLLFNTAILVEKLSGLNLPSLYVPVHNQNAVVASLLYVNSFQSLSSFLDFATESTTFESEMSLLAQWAKVAPVGFFTELPSLPTHLRANKIPTIRNTRIVSTQEIGGLVDAAELGQWFAGIDPRNVPIWKRPKNKFIGPVGNANLTWGDFSNLKLDFDSTTSVLTVLGSNQLRLPLYNLHLHSKIHNKNFIQDDFMPEFTNRVNMDESIIFPGTRKVQILDFVLSYTKIIFRRIKRIFIKG